MDLPAFGNLYEGQIIIILVTLINKSAATNEAVPFKVVIGSRETKRKKFSKRFRAVKEIRRFHHFRVTTDDPLTLYLKELIDGEERPMSIRKSGATPFDATELREKIIPPGLTLERQQYLLRTVRPFVRPANQGELCLTPGEEMIIDRLF